MRPLGGHTASHGSYGSSSVSVTTVGVHPVATVAVHPKPGFQMSGHENSARGRGGVPGERVRAVTRVRVREFGLGPGSSSGSGEHLCYAARMGWVRVTHRFVTRALSFRHPGIKLLGRA